MKRLRTLSLLLFIPGMLFFACGKTGPQGETGQQGVAGPQGTQGAQGEKGDPGVAGEAGARGEDGAAGAQGPQGEKGEAGTANVIYSEWKHFGGSDWGGAGTNRLSLSFYNEPRTDIFTQDVVDRALVLVYTKERENSGARSLPTFATDDETGAIQIITEFSVSVGWLNVGIRSQMGDIPEDMLDNVSSYFRYIIIPGGQLSARKSSLSSPPDYKDYKAVCRYYGIRE